MLQMWTPPEPGQATGSAAPDKNPDDFPGCEEYDDAKNDPRFYSMYTREDEADHQLRREYNVLGNSRHLARKEYLKTGTAPTLAEMLARAPDDGNGSEPPASAAGMDVGIPGHSDNGYENMNLNVPDTTPGRAEIVRPTEAGGSDTPGLKRSLDGYGREIFIEEEAENGEPLIWYQYDSKGNKHRKTRKPNVGILVERVE